MGGESMERRDSDTREGEAVIADMELAKDDDFSLKGYLGDSCEGGMRRARNEQDYV